MNYIIKNDCLEVTISSFGAEIQSIKKSGTEYLWQGDENSWKSRASNLFPYIGRTTGGEYTYKGDTYKMGVHGFARKTDFLTNKINDQKIEFIIKNTDETYKDYPFKFEFHIIYELKQNKVEITFKVLNVDDKDMYFGVGGHPGFITPLEDGLTLEDYYIEFDEKCTPNKYETDPKTVLIVSKSPYNMKDEKIINLEYSLFDNDAIILENMSKKLTLKSDKSDKSVVVEYKDMDYLGIWQSNKVKPKFICIEPWSSLPSRHGVIEDIEKQADILTLNPNKEYNNVWSISIN